MPYFDRINVSKGIDANKRSASNECDGYISWGGVIFQE